MAIDFKDAGKTIRNAALAGTLVAGATLAGSGVARSSNVESAEKSVIPQGALQITFSDGSKILCPDPNYVNVHGEMPGILMTGEGVAGTTLPVNCMPGEQDLDNIYPGHIVQDISIIGFDGKALEVVCADNKVDLHNPTCLPTDDQQLSR